MYENQQFTDELTLEIAPQGKQEKNPFMLAAGEKAVESKIQQMLGINPKVWQELKDKGAIPLSGSYKEFIVSVFNHYRQRNEVSLRKAELIAEKESTKRNSSNAYSDEDMLRVAKAEKVQKIRLDKAREQEIHIKNLASRNDLVDKSELFELFQPLIGNIANILRSAADENPAMQETVDKCFHNLYNVGTKICEQAKIDKTNYVKYMLETPVDLDSIVDSAELELSE